MKPQMLLLRPLVALVLLAALPPALPPTPAQAQAGNLVIEQNIVGSPDPVAVGTNVTYTITLRVTGAPTFPGTGAQLTLLLEIPRFTTFVSGFGAPTIPCTFNPPIGPPDPIRPGGRGNVTCPSVGNIGDGTYNFSIVVLAGPNTSQPPVIDAQMSVNVSCTGCASIDTTGTFFSRIQVTGVLSPTRTPTGSPTATRTPTPTPTATGSITVTTTATRPGRTATPTRMEKEAARLKASDLRAEARQYDAQIRVHEEDCAGLAAAEAALRLAPHYLNAGRIAQLQVEYQYRCNGGAGDRSVIYEQLKSGAEILAQELEQIAADPPDPNYTVIAQANVPPLRLVGPSDSITPAEAGASNLLAANQLQAIAVSRAFLHSIERAQGAAAAGNAAFVARQEEAAGRFAAQLSGLLRNEVTLRVALRDAILTSGRPPPPPVPPGTI